MISVRHGPRRQHRIDAPAPPGGRVEAAPAVPRRRLAGFLAASLALHAAMLAAWHGAATPSFHAAPLSIELIAQPAPPGAQPAPPPEPPDRPAKPRAATRPQPAQEPPRVAKPARITKPESSFAHAPPPDEPDAAPMHATAAPASHAPAAAVPAPAATMEPLRADIEALLRSDLARYFEYPWLARQRGWQGTVLLAITIGPDGVLDQVHVNRSSGYAVLDRSAVETVQRVRRLARAAPRLGGREFELLLPVVYRLTP